MKPTMSAEKTDNLHPVQIVDVSAITAVDVSKSSRLTKKHVLIASVVLITIGLAVTCVLVAIRVFTDSQKEIFKYQMSFKDTGNMQITQNVSVGDGDNTVIYHTINGGADITVIDDFNKNVQVTKMIMTSGVVCFASVLNRSMSLEPNTVGDTALVVNASTRTISYRQMTQPITDITFFGKRISSMCNNIPTYWIQPTCKEDGAETRNRRKRSNCGEICIYFGTLFIRHCIDTPCIYVPWNPKFIPDPPPPVINPILSEAGNIAG